MSIKLEIENANSSHAEAIKAIWNPIIRDTLKTFNCMEKTTQDIKDLISDRDKMAFGSLVGIRSGEVVGFASYNQFRPGTGYLKTMEHTIIVDPKTRGQGVGKSLICGLEDYAKGQGVVFFMAGVSEENASAISFHESLGFRIISVLPEVGFKFGKFLNLVLMQKKLIS